MNMYTLKDFNLNDYGITKSITNEQPIRNDILSLGIVPGIVIKVLEVQDNGYRCLVRNKMVFINSEFLSNIMFEEITR